MSLFLLNHKSEKNNQNMLIVISQTFENLSKYYIERKTWKSKLFNKLNTLIGNYLKQLNIIFYVYKYL